MTPPPLLQLPVLRAVVQVALPMVLLGWVRAAYILADTAWIGWLGDAALAAAAAASFAWWMLSQIGDLAGTGVHALVAQAEGAGDRPLMPRIVWHGAVVGTAVWAVVAVATGLWLPAYLDALALGEGAVRTEAASYLQVSVLAALPFTWQAVVGGVFRGLGDTATALAITVAGFVLNAVLDPLLIWGLGPIPALGMAGAAWATGLSSLLSAAVGLVVLRRRGLGRAAWTLELDLASRITAVGLPVALSGVGFSLVYVLLGRMIAGYGDAPMAALGVGHRLESLSYLVAVGLQVAAATLVGQHIGAGDAPGAGRALRVIFQFTDGAMVVAALAATVLAGPAYAVFATDEAIVASGVVYLRWQAAVWVFMGWECVGEGACAGLARTAPAAWVVALGTAIRIPLAWALADSAGLGVTGIWMAIALSTLTKGVILRIMATRMVAHTLPLPSGGPTPGVSG